MIVMLRKVMIVMLRKVMIVMLRKVMIVMLRKARSSGRLRFLYRRLKLLHDRIL